LKQVLGEKTMKLSDGLFGSGVSFGTAGSGRVAACCKPRFTGAEIELFGLARLPRSTLQADNRNKGKMSPIENFLNSKYLLPYFLEQHSLN
jgi:hypothetical protein